MDSKQSERNIRNVYPVKTIVEDIIDLCIENKHFDKFLMRHKKRLLSELRFLGGDEDEHIQRERGKAYKMLCDNMEMLKECDEWTQKEFQKINSARKIIEDTIDRCIENEVCDEFLRMYRERIVWVLLFGYDSEEHIQMEKEENWVEEKEDIEKKMALRLNKLTLLLFQAKRRDDLLRAAQDPEFQKELLKEFGI